MDFDALNALGNIIASTVLGGIDNLVQLALLVCLYLFRNVAVTFALVALVISSL